MHLSCPKKSEIGTKNQGEYKANKEQEILTAAFDIKVNSSMFSSNEVVLDDMPNIFLRSHRPFRYHPSSFVYAFNQASEMGLWREIEDGRCSC